ncbi:hypothetical protein [Streptomyces sp. NPDC091215]|uniref:hypothetical protein n=1 Tax=Streptomyces sp. NPDC091215 TaxID=3155192 RepID=UPI00341DF5CA
MTTPEPTVDRIPIGHSINYAVRGLPEIADEYNAERTIAPTEITLVYRAAPDSQLGRISAYVKGWWMQDGKRIPMDKPVGRWLYGGPDSWPAWLAAEAQLHDPDAPPADSPDPLRAYVAELDDRLSGCCQECNACAAIARDLAAEMRTEATEATEVPPTA